MSGLKLFIVRGIDTSPEEAHYSDLGVFDPEGISEVRVLSCGSFRVEPPSPDPAWRMTSVGFSSGSCLRDSPNDPEPAKSAIDSMRRAFLRAVPMIRGVIVEGCPEGKPSVIVVERLRGVGKHPASGAEWDAQWVAGRVIEAGYESTTDVVVSLRRTDVKLHLLGSVAGNDAQVNRALYDRFGGDRRRAVGTKKNPGPLYGVGAKHHLQALALAVVWFERTYRRSLG